MVEKSALIADKPLAGYMHLKFDSKAHYESTPNADWCPTWLGYGIRPLEMTASRALTTVLVWT